MDVLESKNILFLCGKYASPDSANSICVQNLAECFLKNKHSVFVLAEGCDYYGQEEYINGVKVKKICGGKYEKIIRFFSKNRIMYKYLFPVVQFLRYIVIYWVYPKSSVFDYLRIYTNAKKIIEDNDIDLIVATTKPYDVVISAMLLKKKYNSKLRVVTYHLDLLSNPNNKRHIIIKRKIQKAQKAFADEMAVIDRILLPQTAVSISSDKIAYVDFPLYIKGSSNNVNNSIMPFDENTINISIAGSLDKNNRNPYYICDIIDSLPKVNSKTVILHIWGKTIDVKKFKNVVYHGLADINDVPLILNNSDFLLNIGNKLTYDMIPSKIFQIFAAKKPIIFCISSEKDKSIPYFSLYGHTCFIKEYEDNVEADLKLVLSFIEDNYLKQLIVDDRLFEKSTPQYICNEILKH